MEQTLPRLPDLPRPITSFGAAVLEGALYVYGGHFGKAHHYYDEGQSGELLRLQLGDDASRAAWQVAATGPRLQGLALLACGGRLVRVGGFTARNSIDAEQDLHSTADVAALDPRSGTWSALPPLPAGRSSFDAGVLGGKLYVVGGWQLHGGDEPRWHGDALCLDPADPAAAWRAVAEPPRRRRALAVAPHEGKLYGIGGMQPDGNVTGCCDVYDPAADAWTPGPDLPGDDMEGFGSAACSAGGSLYVSTRSGKLWRLEDASWRLVKQLRDGRFFHRMLPSGERQLAILGGANMQSGKFARVEVVDVG